MRRWSITERAFAILEKIRHEDDQEEKALDLWHPDKPHGQGGPQKPHPPCPSGQVRNKTTGRCVALRGAKHF
jgi:hypothetical protein